MKDRIGYRGKPNVKHQKPASKNQSLITNYPLLITEKGLTLLEIAISLAILSIALIGLAHLFPIGLHSSRRAANFSEAGILAQRVVENIRRAASVYDSGDRGINANWSDRDGMGYFELVNPDTAPYSEPDAEIDLSGAPTFIYKYSGVDMSAHVRSETETAIGDTKLIQKVYVGIYWKEGENERADTFVTYITNPFYEKYK
ncbi:MAG TPA: prepilin-type N-terminal cleavage/methylation domain-containing protein [Candidatus Omnitrophica bacterium]|nr:prepilin-type N-terminal cleavage/methylation domain-containing protein [Candidatus Omnitrophota bacterium]